MDLTHGKSLSYQQFFNMGLLITSGKSKKKETPEKRLLIQNRSGYN